MIIMIIIINNLQTITFLLISTITFTFSYQTSDCQNTCGTGEDKKSVQYPFGFSPGCPIRLDCNSDTATINIGEFSVLNITADGITIDVPPKCNRPLNSIESMFSYNYALSWRNGFLLQNCPNSLNCAIPTSLVTSRFNSQSCYSNISNNISCFSEESDHGIDVLTYQSVNRTNCSFLFSSIAVGSSYSYELQRIELVWWVNGSCIAATGCDRNANCSGVQLVNGNGYRCVCKSGFEGDGFAAGDGCRKETKSGSSNGKRGNTKIIIVVSTAVPTILITCICIWVFLRAKKSRKNVNDVDGDGNEITSAESLQYDFNTINVATNNFSHANKLGQGGFGAVYKGSLPNGQEVAVKRLAMNSGQGDLEFKNEVVLVAKLQHRNLVKLLGFCFEGVERLLIYEFVPNTSLDHFIFDPIKRKKLDWEKRYKIIEGIARGLLYLHEDSRIRIIHRDLKASNVLLDAEMSPKISDFGMARLFTMNQTEAATNRIVGTYGYMAPEYALYGQFSVKSDVFSFGVIVLEIVTGRKGYSFQNNETDDEDLFSFAWRNWRDGTATSIADPTISSVSSSELLRCIHIGLLCVQESIADRPTMALVAQMLNNYSLSLPFPSQPTIIMRTGTKLYPRMSESKKSDKGDASQSTNEASMTELYPR